MEREDRMQRGGGVGTAPAHAGLDRDPLRECESNPARQPERLMQQARGSQDQVVAPGRHPVAHRPSAHGGRFVANPHGEAAWGALGLERVGERDRLEHGHELVIAIRAARTHRQPEVELRTRLDDDAPRLLGAAHRARYRIQIASAMNNATAAWIGRSESNTCDGSSLVSETRTRCR